MALLVVLHNQKNFVLKTELPSHILVTESVTSYYTIDIAHDYIIDILEPGFHRWNRSLYKISYTSSDIIGCLSH